MHRQWLRLGRVLWVLLALNSIVMFVATQWVMFQMLREPSVRLVQSLAEIGMSPTVYGMLFLLSDAIIFLTHFVAALLIFLRRPNDGYGLLVAVFFVNWGAINAYPDFAEFQQFFYAPPLWYAIPSFISTVCSYPIFVYFFALYPDGKFVPPWMRYVAAFSLVMAIFWGSFPDAFRSPSSWVAFVGGAAVAFWIGATLYAQIWRYRYQSSVLQRQQLKWFTLAVALQLIAAVLEIFIPLLEPSGAQSGVASVFSDLTFGFIQLSLVSMPIAVGIAILRYRLWDIDVLIRRTATYGLLAALLAAIYFGSVILLQQLFVSISGQHSEVITVISTLAIAALFVPLRNRIQGEIDKRFNRKKYDAQKVLGEFATTVRDETDLEKLTGSLVGVVNETMQPKSVSLWLKQSNKL